MNKLKASGRSFIFLFLIAVLISGCASTTPLIRASKAGNSLAIQKLLNEGADINKRDSYGWTPLFWAIHYKHLATAKLLIDNGVDIDAQDYSGATALHYTDAPMLIEYLLDRNVNTGLKNADGRSALRQAIYDKKMDKVSLIRRKTNWQGEIYPLTYEEKIGRSIYAPEKDMFDVPFDKESAYKLAVYDCNAMLFKNVGAVQLLVDINFYGIPALARLTANALLKERVFQLCMAKMGFECKKNCSEDVKHLIPKEVALIPKVEEPDALKKNVKIENKDETVIDADPKYSNIKAIVLNNGKVIEGQIISINANVLKIRTKEDKISSYSFMNVKEYIKK